MNKKADEVLKKIEKIDETGSLGSVPRSTGEFLRLLVLATKSRKVLELGCSLGYSTIWMALAAREISGHIYTTEISEDRIPLAKGNFKAAELDKYITLFEKDIIGVLSNWDLGKVDFVFIDAQKADYLRYYELVLPLLKNGGLIVADDVGKFKDKVKSFLEKVSKDSGVISQFLDIDDGLMLIYKK